MTRTIKKVTGTDGMTYRIMDAGRTGYIVQVKMDGAYHDLEGPHSLERAETILAEYTEKEVE